MKRIPSTILAAAVSSALMFLASPSFADTTIKVIESGEGGGARALTLEPTAMKGGTATLRVHNDATTEEHEMVVVKLKSADEKIPFNEAKHRVNESKLKSMGEVSDLKPGASGELKANLKAGTYLLFCNIRGHYEAGMAAKLVVTP